MPNCSRKPLPLGLSCKARCSVFCGRTNRRRQSNRVRQPCLVFGRNTDAHRLRFTQLRAMERKVIDEFRVFLCRTHQRDNHSFGDELTWRERRLSTPSQRRGCSGFRISASHDDKELPIIDPLLVSMAVSLIDRNQRKCAAKLEPDPYRGLTSVRSPPICTKFSDRLCAWAFCGFFRFGFFFVSAPGLARFCRRCLAAVDRLH
jgi:hypothetical protein